MTLASGFSVFVWAQTNPSPGLDDLTRGVELYRSGDTKGAIKAYQLSLKKNPNNPDAWHSLGLAYFQEGNFREARKSFEGALKLRPDHAPTSTSLAICYLMMGEFSKAEKQARKSLSLKSDNPQAHFVIGTAKLNEGKDAEALEEAEAALKLNPDFSAALILKSRALAAGFFSVYADPKKEANGEEIRRAAESLERAIKLDPKLAANDRLQEQAEALKVYAEAFDGNNTQRTIYRFKEIDLRPEIIYKEKAVYTQAARAAGIQGTVRLLVTFAVDGRIKHIIPIQSLGHGLTQQAIAAAQKISFKAALMNGKPVAMIGNLEYSFNLY